jgi:hypothetical protein
MTKFFKVHTDFFSLYETIEEAESAIADSAKDWGVDPQSLKIVKVEGYDAGCIAYDLYVQEGSKWNLLEEEEYGGYYPPLPEKFGVGLPL